RRRPAGTDDRLLPHRRTLGAYLVRPEIFARLRKGQKLRWLLDGVGQPGQRANRQRRQAGVMAQSHSPLPSADPDALLRTIGNTPLIPLLLIGTEFPHVRFFAKAEWFNPGGSVKDRAGYRMIRAAEISGK